MKLGPTDITMIFGMRGTGKSTLTRKLSEIYPRRVIIDRLEEWNDHDDGTFIFLRSYSDFQREFPRVFHRDRFTLVFQFDVGMEDDESGAEFDSLLRAIYRSGRESGIGTCVVIEEVQHFASPHFLSRWLREVLLTGRHAGIAMVANSQRPAHVHKTLISQARHVFTGQLYEPRDVKYIEETLSSEIASLIPSLPKFTFIGFTPGEGSVRVEVSP